MVKGYQAGIELLGLADALRNKHLIEARDRSDHAAMIEDLKSDKKAFLARWRAICKPNSLVEDLILDFPTHGNIDIEFGRKECEFVVAKCEEAGFDFDRSEVQNQVYDWRLEFLDAFEDSTENGKHKQRAKFCELFTMDFFHPFLKGLLLSEDISDCEPKLLFAPLGQGFTPLPKQSPKRSITTLATPSSANQSATAERGVQEKIRSAT